MAQPRSPATSTGGRTLCVAQRPVLDAVLGALAEDAAVALLADEGEPAGTELIRDPLQPLTGTREVGAAQVGDPGVVRGAAFVRPMP